VGAAQGLYASMWNRQREAEAAREKLAQIGDSTAAPHPTLEGADDDGNADRGQSPVAIVTSTAAE
jgi:ATP-binding cassette subfamily B protein